jgi:hypothetical protein
MAAWHKVDRLHAGTQRLRSDRADPAFAAQVTVGIDAVRRVLTQFGIDFEMQLDNIS